MFSFVISINSTHAGGCVRQAKVSAYAAWRQTSCHGRGGEEGLGLKRSCCSSIRELVVRQGKDMRGDWLWVAIGSGKSMERGSTFWQIALSHRDCLQESVFFVFAGNCTIFVQSWKGSSSDNEQGPVNSFCWASGWFVTSRQLKFSPLSCSSYLLTCLQQTDNFVALKKIIILEAISWSTFCRKCLKSERV